MFLKMLFIYNNNSYKHLTIFLQINNLFENFFLIIFNLKIIDI